MKTSRFLLFLHTSAAAAQH